MKLTIHEYLANYSPNRAIDQIFIKWYGRVYTHTHSIKEKKEWEAIYSDFMNETDGKPAIKREETKVSSDTKKVETGAK